MARTDSTLLRVVDDRPPPAVSPKVALVSVTTFCNAHCSFCCVLDILNKPDLNPSDALVMEKIREGRERGCTTLGMTGGEPTVHPRFTDFCRYGRELGYESITINTNGIKFKSRDWTRKALEAGLSNIDFSIHGATAEVHDEMVERAGAFAAIEKGCAHLRELSSEFDFVMGATTVVTATNALELPAIATVLLDLGFTTLRFKHCFEGDVGSDVELVARYDEMMPAVRRAVVLAQERGAGVQLTHFPLCLLEEEVVFATDMTTEDVISYDRDGRVMIEGRASQHRRVTPEPCAACMLADTCSMLDERYVAVHGADELRPLAEPEALTAFFGEGFAGYDIGEAMRREIGERLEARGARAPNVLPREPRRGGPRTESIHLGQSEETRCTLGCASLCDCASSASAVDEEGVPQAVRAGGEALYLRGEALAQPGFDATLAAAKGAGWREVWLRTSGLRFGSAGEVAGLVESGVTGVVVPLFSHAPAIHDQIVGQPGALVAAMRTLRAASESGLAVAAEVPLLSMRVQNLDALLRFLHRTVPSIAYVRLHVPKQPQPQGLAPPRWDEARGALARAHAASRELPITLRAADYDGIPRCALPEEMTRDVMSAIDPTRPVARREGFIDNEVCAACATQPYCLGPTASYHVAHGTAGLTRSSVVGAIDGTGPGAGASPSAEAGSGSDKGEQESR